MAQLEYDVIFISYSQAGYINSDCNEITFLNLGTATANVESVPLMINQSMTVNGNSCEHTSKQFQLTFTNSGSQIQNLVVIRKVYINA